MEETVRLNKFLSEKGICSRREADRLVDEGKVMVNGVCAAMGQKVSSADEIVVDGKKVSHITEVSLRNISKMNVHDTNTL